MHVCKDFKHCVHSIYTHIYVYIFTFHWWGTKRSPNVFTVLYFYIETTSNYIVRTKHVSRARHVRTRDKCNNMPRSPLHQDQDFNRVFTDLMNYYLLQVLLSRPVRGVVLAVGGKAQWMNSHPASSPDKSSQFTSRVLWKDVGFFLLVLSFAAIFRKHEQHKDARCPSGKPQHFTKYVLVLIRCSLALSRRH